jgi:hypothetical protein
MRSTAGLLGRLPLTGLGRARCVAISDRTGRSLRLRSRGFAPCFYRSIVAVPRSCTSYLKFTLDMVVPHAMVFVNEVADAAEAAGHHPDIDIRWNKVTLALSSHDEGGLTDRDFQLAARIQELDQPTQPA